jgi:hypothetical protein
VSDAALVSAPAARRAAWSALDGQFRANLAVVDERTGLGAALLETWRASVRGLQLVRDERGCWQVHSRLPDAPGWLPARLPHDQLCDETTLRSAWRGKVIRTIALHGLGLGYVARAIIRASETTFLQFSPHVLLFEPNLLAWAVVLHLHDWRDCLNLPRVRPLAGPDAAAQLDAELADPERARPVVLHSSAPWPGSGTPVELEQRAAAAEAARAARQRELFDRIECAYLARCAPYWRKRFADAVAGRAQLRILGISSRYTTVLQFTLRALLDALAARSHATRLWLEADDHAHFSPLRVVETIAAHDPDLVILVDHPAASFAGVLPEGLPVLTWIQDRLPHLFRPEAGRAIRPLEFVLGHGFPELLLHFGYPAERFLPTMIPTDAAALRAGSEETEAELAPYRCDVMFATHATELLDERIARLRAAFDAPLRAAFDAAVAELRDIAAAPRFNGDYNYERLALDALGSAGLDAPAAVPQLVGDLRTLADQILRERTIRAVADWAVQRGRSFRLYGRGWDRRPELARYACGPIAPGRDFARACRAAAICLHAGVNSALHQRVLDGLCAGGFYLLQYRPSDWVASMTRAIYERIRGRRPPLHLSPADLPEPHATTWADLLRNRGDDPARGQTITPELMAILRLECELNLRPTPGALWPAMIPATPHAAAAASVVYRDGDELRSKLDRFVDAHAERAAIAADMRRAVERSLTYDALADRLLRYLAEALAGRTPRLLP